MNEFLQRVWAGSEATVVAATVSVIIAMCGAVAFKIIQFFNDLRKARAIEEKVAAVQQLSVEGTTNEEKRNVVDDLLAEDPRVKTWTGDEVEAAVYKVKRMAAPATKAVPCPPGTNK